MADVAEIQLMKVSNFSDGTDAYKGIRRFGYRRNPQPSYGVRLEGELQPSRLEPVESDTPNFSGVATFSGPNAAALQGTVIAAATVDCRDVTDASDTVTITVTNMLIKGFNTQIDNLRTGEFAYDFEATNITATVDA